MTTEQINKIFTYNPPKEGQPDKYVALRQQAKVLAELINTLCPESREKSLAITSVQQTIMWANASIAINE